MRIPNEKGNLGKYDGTCEAVLMATGAQLVALIVMGGNKGNGFSVSTVDSKMLDGLPEALESMAQDIRAQNNQRKNQ